MSKEESNGSYGLAERSAKGVVAAPDLPYEVSDPRNYNPNIALVGCGGITEQHLIAYKRAGYNVVALCDIDSKAAQNGRDKYYPDAQIFTDYKDVLKLDAVEVIDFATHPEVRYKMMLEAVSAQKHILSQKPFVTDLDQGERLVEAADKGGVKIAVNQNGRWAPHFSYMRQAIKSQLIGEVAAVHMGISWNHNWIAGTPFEEIHELILFDFGIHWFDMLSAFLHNKEIDEVYAVTATFPQQEVKPPMLAQVMVSGSDCVGSITFDADTLYGEEDRTTVIGRRGTIKSFGPDLNEQEVHLFTQEGLAIPSLKGTWFPDGFHGTMAELLCSIEEGREPENSGRNNLKSLALCFAAIESARQGKPLKPGEARKYENL
jgi:predicted dehydrogenase